jgi:hypothetical protein
LFRDVIVPMKLNFLKYWLNIPLLYSFAFILDPRAKLTGFNIALQVLFELLNHDYSTYYNEVKSKLANMFAKYDSKFDSLRLQKPSLVLHQVSNLPLGIEFFMVLVVHVVLLLFLILVLDLVLLHVMFLSYQLIWIVILLTNMMNHLMFLIGGKIIKELTMFSLFWLRIS